MLCPWSLIESINSLETLAKCSAFHLTVPNSLVVKNHMLKV